MYTFDTLMQINKKANIYLKKNRCLFSILSGSEEFSNKNTDKLSDRQINKPTAVDSQTQKQQTME